MIDRSSLQLALRRRFRLTYRGGATAYLFVLPSVIFIGVFVIVPIVGALYYSFTNYDLLTPPEWVGLKNYQVIGKEPRFWPSVRNTMLFALGTVPAGVITSLLLAVLVNRAIRGIYFFRAMFYMPVVSSFVSVSLIFLWMYEPQFGLANAFLRALDLPASKWLRGPETALFAIILMSIWKNMGLNMVIYLAGLQGIPPHLYEAAEIDGAGRLSQMFRITVPLLAPTTYFVVIVYFIGALQMFVQVFIMSCNDPAGSCGGPLDSTITIVMLIYLEAFLALRMGFAAALSFILFVLIGAVTILNARVLSYEIGY
ncbi:MAG: sugar ABC transporter permease [Chloroflexi bacterium]|nr:sugar ABC transporter permease [Chloroflexota bacterium]MXY00250.1 sugar ABC transporter permease [Chloroflexota bacterium]MYB16628.1 sugar ABC transporter permease [Chloroflexota bacterium]